MRFSTGKDWLLRVAVLIAVLAFFLSAISVNETRKAAEEQRDIAIHDLRQEQKAAKKFREATSKKIDRQHDDIVELNQLVRDLLAADTPAKRQQALQNSSARITQKQQAPVQPSTRVGPPVTQPSKPAPSSTPPTTQPAPSPPTTCRQLPLVGGCSPV